MKTPAVKGLFAAVTLAAAPLLAVAEDEEALKPYDAVVDYVESTGTQWVNTGVNLGTDHKVVLKFAFPDQQSFGGFFGMAALNHARSFYVSAGLTSTGNAMIKPLVNDTMADYTFLELGRRTDEVHELVLSKSEFVMDGIRMLNNGTFTGTCNGPAYLFGFYLEWATTAPGCGRIRLMACQIYSGTTLVRDYRPVSKDGVGYVYDLCNPGALCATGGKGTLTAGPVSADQTLGKLTLTKDVSNRNQRLAYVEGTGEQCLAVDAKEGKTTETTIVYAYTDTAPRGCLYGYSALSSQRSVIVNRNFTDAKERIAVLHMEYPANVNHYSSEVDLNTDKHVVKIGPTQYTLDGVPFGTASAFTADLTRSAMLLAIYKDWLFNVSGLGYWQGTTILNSAKEIDGAKARIYSFRMKRDGKLVRDLVPMRTAVGIGLWDKVDKRFHPCIANGSTGLVAGPPLGSALIVR